MLRQLDDGTLDQANLVWSDECFFAAGDYISRQWCKPGQEPEPLPKERWAPKCHVFGLMWETGSRVVLSACQRWGPVLEEA